VRLVNSPFRYQRRYIGKRLTTLVTFLALSQALLNAHTGISLVAMFVLLILRFVIKGAISESV
ncbi:hypothetical protein L1K70_23655, partial [Salmonella enterica subsp. enterica serovar Anatum]|nr:hypothetical protein [Salmonella enterica subsp. enterica serovar Anatum]